MNCFGDKYRVTIFGESHGESLGVVLDGVPSGIPLSETDFIADLDRRRSGSVGTTARRESDTPHIISGIYNGYTTGAPLTIIFKNGDCRSDDYNQISAMPRPGHADYVAKIKYGGYNDIRGGGHFSGRLTLCLVAAGVVAKLILKDINISASLVEVGGYTYEERESIESAIAEAIERGDSLGGVVRCECDGVKIGVGEPFFNSVESVISHAIFAIPGVRGIEFGDGFGAAALRGSVHNDCYIDGQGRTSTNGAGGINGGIANGNKILFNVAIKPTSTISLGQESFNFETNKIDSVSYKGRHDVCFALRVPVVVEAVTAISLANLL